MTASERRAAWAHALLESPSTVTFCAVLAHLPALRNKLACDDAPWLRYNGSLRTVRGLWHLLASPAWFPASDPGAEAVYRPASAAFDWLSWQLLRAASAPQHAISVALHALLALLLVRTLTTYGARASHAAATGILFAVHPVTAEAVAPLGARPIVLGAIVLVYLLHRIRSATVVHAGMWAFIGTVVATLCHEVFALTPLVVLAVSMGPHAGRRLLLASLGGLMGLVVVIALPAWIPFLVSETSVLCTGAAIALHDSTLIVAPITQSPFFTPAAMGTPAIVALLFVGIAAILCAFRSAEPLTRGGIILAVMAPFGFAAAAIRGGVASDRGAYLVLVGLALALPPIAAALVERTRWTVSPPISLAPIVVAFAMMPLTWSSDTAWRDDRTLRRAIVANDPKDQEADLARALLALDENDIASSYPVCKAYADARPGSTRAHLCVGAGLLANGRPLASLAYLGTYAHDHPDQELARRALFAALLAAGQFGSARTAVVSWQATFPKAPDVDAARGLLVERGLC